MIRPLLLMCCCLVFAGSPALAAPLPDAVPDAATLERMCSGAGAMQYTFGQTGVPGSTQLERLSGSSLALSDVFAPFVKATPSATEWSGKLAQVSYSVTYQPDQKVQAQASLKRIAGALVQSGWMPLDLNLDEAPMYLLGFAGENGFYKDVDVAAAKTRVFASLTADLGTLEFACAREDLVKLHGQEAFGKLPPGTPRPLLPVIEVPTIRSEAECAAPEVQAQISAILSEGKVDSFMAQMLARTSYRDRLTQWMLWKLDSSGKITPERLIKLSFSAIGGASPGGDPFASFKMIEGMFPIIEQIDAAQKTRDPEKMCRSLIPFQKWITTVDALTLKQSQAAHAALTAEARRLGVSFD